MSGYDDPHEYYKKAVALVADTLEALQPSELVARAPKLVAILRNAAARADETQRPVHCTCPSPEFDHQEHESGCPRHGGEPPALNLEAIRSALVSRSDTPSRDALLLIDSLTAQLAEARADTGARQTFTFRHGTLGKHEYEHTSPCIYTRVRTCLDLHPDDADMWCGACRDVAPPDAGGR